VEEEGDVVEVVIEPQTKKPKRRVAKKRVVGIVVIAIESVNEVEMLKVLKRHRVKLNSYELSFFLLQD
jgi:hypothetical protein